MKGITTDGQPPAPDNGAPPDPKLNPVLLTQLNVLISTSPSMCRNPTNLPNLRWLNIQLNIPGTVLQYGVYSVNPGEPQTYPRVDQPTVFAQLGHLDAACHEDLSGKIEASGGTVTVTSLDPKGAFGSFEIEFGSGGSAGTLRGTFRTHCLFDNASAAIPDPACKS